MFIDIHGHTTRGKILPNPLTGGQIFTYPEDLVKVYDANGIEVAVMLPLCNPENVPEPQSNEDILEVAAKFPGRFIPFCNIDPRSSYNSPSSPLNKVLAYYKSQGCKGVGEVCANLPILDPRVQNLFSAAEENDMPLTFHLAPKEGGLYGLVDDTNLPGLEESLRRHPNLKFFGHSQTFWCEISEIRSWDDRFGYPTGPVKNGAIPRLMREYPNLYGDLSAGSGCNALTRDMDHAVAFLNEFQDRLMFGTDICAPGTMPNLNKVLIKLRDEGRISETVFQKIARENAIRLLKL